MKQQDHICDEECDIALAVGVCEGCGFIEEACKASIELGYLKCCPDCKHPTEAEIRAKRTALSPSARN